MASTTTSRLSTSLANYQIAVKTPCVTVSTTNLTLSSTQTINSVVVVSGDRVLAKDQTDATENGIYDVSTGTWTRSTDFAASGDCVRGTLVMVPAKFLLYYLSSTGINVPDGSSNIAFTVFT